MSTNTITYYRFVSHTRRLVLLTIIAALVLLVSGTLALLGTFNALPDGFQGIIVTAYIVAVLALTVLMPVGYFLYSYTRSGVWIGPDEVRVQFPGESPQQIAWSETVYAINEGEEYLALSKGKEGLGLLVGKTRYIRLHLEGMLPEQRRQAEQEIARHVAVRQPRLFTLMTLLNAKGDLVARGRLYLFENEVLCAENRGEKRIFFDAPLQDLKSVKRRNSFYVGRLECEAFVVKYKEKEYVIMLGYETTITSSLGNSSNWSVTGSAQEWVEALQ
jgi:hypothetical protein